MCWVSSLLRSRFGFLTSCRKAVLKIQLSRMILTLQVSGATSFSTTAHLVTLARLPRFGLTQKEQLLKQSFQGLLLKMRPQTCCSLLLLSVLTRFTGCTSASSPTVHQFHLALSSSALCSAHQSVNYTKISESTSLELAAFLSQLFRLFAEQQRWCQAPLVYPTQLLC